MTDSQYYLKPNEVAFVAPIEYMNMLLTHLLF